MKLLYLPWERKWRERQGLAVFAAMSDSKGDHPRRYVTSDWQFCFRHNTENKRIRLCIAVTLHRVYRQCWLLRCSSVPRPAAWPITTSGAGGEGFGISEKLQAFAESPSVRVIIWRHSILKIFLNRQLCLRATAPGAHYLECSDRRFLVSDKDAVAGDLVRHGRCSETLPHQCTASGLPQILLLANLF